MAIRAADQTSKVAQCIAFLPCTQATGVHILTSAKLFLYYFYYNLVVRFSYVFMYDVIKIVHLILHFCTLFSFYSFCIMYFLFSKIIVKQKRFTKIWNFKHKCNRRNLTNSWRTRTRVKLGKSQDCALTDWATIPHGCGFANIVYTLNLYHLCINQTS